MSPSFFSVRRSLAAGGVVLLLGGSAVGIAAAQTAPTSTPSTGQAQPGFQAFVKALAQHLGVTPAALQTAIGQARTDVGLPATGGFGPGRGGPRGPGDGGDLTAAATVIGIPTAQLQQELATKSLTDVAQAHAKNPADVAAALKTAATQRLDQAVASGRLTADQATQQKQQLDQRIAQQMALVGAREGRGGPRGFGRNLDAAATAIGIPVAQLQQELPGKSLTQVAQAHSKNPADVAAALKTAATQRIDQAVTAGRLTADQATQQKQQLDQQIGQQMTQVAPTGGRGA